MSDTRVSLRAGKAPTSVARPTVDREAKVIRGVIVAGVGPAEGHGFDLDATSLQQIHDLGVAAGSKGSRSHFKHPNACGDALGTYVGRPKDFRLDGDVVRADIHLAQAAFKGPKGENYGDYLLNLAEEAPDAFGMSVVIHKRLEKRRNPDGSLLRNPDGTEPPPVARIFRLKGVDFVADPATGRSLLAAGDELAQLSAILDRQFAGLTLQQIETRAADFISSYLSNRPSLMTTAANAALSAGAAATPPAAAAPAPVPAAATQAPAAVEIPAQLAAAKAEGIAAERLRQSELSALCGRAGKSALAILPKLISDGTSVELAGGLILQAQLAASQVLGADATAPTGEPAGQKPEDKYKAEYAEHAALHAKNNITEEQYIKSRKVDDGLAHLAK